MKNTTKSKNPCPFCGSREWALYWLNERDEVKAEDPSAYAFITLIDGMESSILARFLDECLGCGAVASTEGC